MEYKLILKDILLSLLDEIELNYTPGHYEKLYHEIKPKYLRIKIKIPQSGGSSNNELAHHSVNLVNQISTNLIKYIDEVHQRNNRDITYLLEIKSLIHKGMNLDEIHYLKSLIQNR